MKVTPRETINRIRTDNHRISSRLKREDRQPHLQVVSSRNGDVGRIPTLTSDGDRRFPDYLWIDHPRANWADPISIYANEQAQEPVYTAVRQGGRGAASVVTSTDGNVVLTIEPNRYGTILRTRWKVSTPSRPAQWRVTERWRDALWRRMFGLPSQVDNEDLGFLTSIWSLPSLLVPALRLGVEDSGGAQIGQITFASADLRPRENFCVYLTNTPYPMRDQLLATAIIVLMQRMH